MDTDRILIRKRLSEIPSADTFFRRLSGVDPAAVPEKYGNSVSLAHAALLERAEAVLLIRRLPILAQSEEEIRLADGFSLTGAMPPKVLQQAKEIYGE